ncbi:MAG TPA: hypothetical protein PKC03_17515 [Dokdonella sp.]|nr:hypothetical protein [Dokdonella sp.]HRK77860.1 hypothetical protein [Thiobacillus sp.]
MNQYYAHLHPIVSCIHFNTYLHPIFQIDDASTPLATPPISHDLALRLNNA